uniref:Uncharacterized protein n=1 Tax=Peromyscus maniculatus bairdii TaxID=230844 RepID=A0A8C8W436_PERMB
MEISVVNKMSKDGQMRAAINQKLIEPEKESVPHRVPESSVNRVWLEGSVEGTL